MVEGKHTIGLNETQLGIVAPRWFRDMYISIIGYRQAELALTKYIRYLINMYVMFNEYIMRSYMM